MPSTELPSSCGPYTLQAVLVKATPGPVMGPGSCCYCSACLHRQTPPPRHCCTTRLHALFSHFPAATPQTYAAPDSHSMLHCPITWDERRKEGRGRGSPDITVAVGVVGKVVVEQESLQGLQLNSSSTSSTTPPPVEQPWLLEFV